MKTSFALNEFVSGVDAFWYGKRGAAYDSARSVLWSLLPGGMDPDSVDLANLHTDDPELWEKIQSAIAEIRSLDREIRDYKPTFKSPADAMLLGARQRLPEGWNEFFISDRPMPGSDEDVHYFGLVGQDRVEIPGRIRE